MKVNDTVPVTIAGQVVAQARITGLEDGKATLIVPATQVVMATRTELAVETPTEGATVQIIGDEPANEAPVEQEAPVVEEKPAEEQSAPIVAGSEAPDAPAQETDVSE